MKKLFHIMSNFQAHYHFQLDFQKVDQPTGGRWLIHGTKHHSTRVSCKARNSPVGYPSWESKHDINKSEGNMFNSIHVLKNAGTETSRRVRIYRTRQKSQMCRSKWIGHKNSPNSSNHHGEIAFYQGISKSDTRTLKTRTAHLQKTVL